MVRADGSYVVDLVVPSKITYRRIVSEPGRERATELVTRPLLTDDVMTVSVSRYWPSGLQTGHYDWQKATDDVYVAYAPARSVPQEAMDALGRHGYVLPSVPLDEIAGLVDDSLADRWAEANEKSCIGSGGPCLEWVDARIPSTSWRFDGEPFCLSVRQRLGSYATDAESARAAVRDISNQVVSVEVTEWPESGVDLEAQACNAIRDVAERPDLDQLESALGHVAWRVFRSLIELADFEFADELVAIASGGTAPSDPVEIGQVLMRQLSPVLPASVQGETKASLDAWSQSGLGQPFVPGAFADTLRELDEWSWGSVPSSARVETSPGDPLASYMLAPEVNRFLDGDWRPRFHVCHAGHGVNSYGINYVVVTDRVAAFAQTGWGGVYMDERRTAANVIDLGADLEQVFAFADSVRFWPPGRLLLVHSDFRGHSSPAWVPHPGAEPESIDTDGLLGVPGGLHEVHRLWLAENAPSVQARPFADSLQELLGDHLDELK